MIGKCGVLALTFIAALHTYRSDLLQRLLCLFLIACAWVGFSQPAWCQAATLSGMVKSETDEPLSGVYVFLVNTQFHDTTDYNGRFQIRNVPAGKYTLRVAKLGYVAQNQTVQLAAGQTLALEFSLQRFALTDVIVRAPAVREEISWLPTESGTYLTAGARNEVVQLQASNANVMQNYARSVFTKVPGAFVYEFDGTGNALNISTRGLDPHRNWEFNIRQNDLLINSDIYGYPANHYNPPLEAVEQVQLIRGSAALQYGAQFGGMLNFVLNQPDTTRPLALRSQLARGSFDFLAVHNELSGRIGKFDYFAFYNHRVSDGYRINSDYQYDAWHTGFTYRMNQQMKLKAEVSHMYYVNHLAGALNDSMFHADPRQSTRSRNYYAPNIVVPGLRWDWKLNDATEVNVVASSLLGSRNSVLFVALSTTPDQIDANTLQYAPRQVDIDNFSSHNLEGRLLHRYALGSLNNRIVLGVRAVVNDMRRRRGIGTTGTDYDLTTSSWRRDIDFLSRTLAFFVENQFMLTDHLSLIPGVRLERGSSEMSGYNYFSGATEPTTLAQIIDHNYLLVGGRAEYNPTPSWKLYGGWNQCYRPMILKDIIPSTDLDLIDPNLKDVTGWNAELGARGRIQEFLQYDVSLFALKYNDRIGTLVQQDAQGAEFFYKTNVGDNLNKGVEVYAELSPLAWTNGEGLTGLSVFTASAWMDARYTSGSVVVTGPNGQKENKDIEGNQVESAPQWNIRSGITYRFRGFSATGLFSYVSKTFADPLNTELPNASGTLGAVPAYQLVDVFLAYYFANWNIKCSVTNVMDQKYFSKRPSFFPDPGIWPGDGRSIIFSAGFRL